MLVSKIKGRLARFGIDAVVSDIARSAHRNTFLRKHPNHMMFLVADTEATWKTFAASVTTPCFIGVASPIVAVGNERVSEPVYHLIVAD